MTGKSCHSSATNASSSTAANTTATATANTITTTNTISSVGGTTTTTTTSTSTSSTTTTTSSHIQNSLKSLNKASYKISKPLAKNSNPNSTGPSLPPAPVSSGSAPPQQSQPPVYNIDKNDFRDVVQKLTGSPAHHQPRPTTPPPPPPPAAAPAATSRLHRIRPPPLAHLTPRPAPSIPAPPPPASAPADVWTRRPLSPLPPLPTVSAAAESPISAYMRRLRSSGSGQLPLVPSPTAAAAAALLLPAPTSPLGFGCLPSPRTAYQMMLSPGMVFPTSPGVRLPSPRWGDP